ncbi:hypothetical protein J6590_028818 [Homalodisca vitripennis]|nr:hypothetical protein J6590_028818 [Homalodisca vitripennis]
MGGGVGSGKSCGKGSQEQFPGMNIDSRLSRLRLHGARRGNDGRPRPRPPQRPMREQLHVAGRCSMAPGSAQRTVNIIAHCTEMTVTGRSCLRSIRSSMEPSDIISL